MTSAPIMKLTGLFSVLACAAYIATSRLTSAPEISATASIMVMAFLSIVVLPRNQGAIVPIMAFGLILGISLIVITIFSDRLRITYSEFR